MNDDLTDKQLNTILDERLRMGRGRLSIVRDPLLKAVELSINHEFPVSGGPFRFCGRHFAQNARITKELFLEEVKNIWESRKDRFAALKKPLFEAVADASVIEMSKELFLYEAEDIWENPEEESDLDEEDEEDEDEEQDES
jgi:hypothetical protein